MAASASLALLTLSLWMMLYQEHEKRTGASNDDKIDGIGRSGSSSQNLDGDAGLGGETRNAGKMPFSRDREWPIYTTSSDEEEEEEEARDVGEEGRGRIERTPAVDRHRVRFPVYTTSSDEEEEADEAEEERGERKRTSSAEQEEEEEWTSDHGDKGSDGGDMVGEDRDFSSSAEKEASEVVGDGAGKTDKTSDHSAANQVAERRQQGHQREEHGSPGRASKDS